MSIEVAKEVGAGSVMKDGVYKTITFTPELLEQYNKRLIEKGLLAGAAPGTTCNHFNEEAVGEDSDGDDVMWCPTCGRVRWEDGYMRHPSMTGKEGP